MFYITLTIEEEGARPINIHTVDNVNNVADTDRLMGDSDRDSSTYSQVKRQRQITNGISSLRKLFKYERQQ